jgi:hypothetical protein
MKKLFLVIAILFTAIAVPAWPHDTQAAPSDYFDTVQKVYIGYYQRPADPGGLLYWAGRLNGTGGNLNEIIEAYANSDESRALYGTINSDNIGTVVDSIYVALFNRRAETGGKTYYEGGFKSGQFTAATIMLNVLYGAQNQDLLSVANKVTASNLFTRTIAPELDARDLQYRYSGDADAQTARDFLSAVTSDPATVPAEDEIRACMDSCEQLKQLNVPCESVLMGPYFVRSTFDDSVTATVASDENGDALALQWVPAEDVIDLFVALPGEQPVGYQQYTQMPSLKQANMITAVMLGLNSSSPAGNKAGCDGINDWPWLGSCEDHGKCCDQHDICIDKKCTGPNDSGDVRDCAMRGPAYAGCSKNCPPFDYNCTMNCAAKFPQCSPECQECHDIVLNCYFKSPPPGKSNCCDRNGNNVCGEPQACIIDDYVETNPQVCKDFYEGDPTFIQLSRRIMSQSKTLNKNSRKDLVASITVPDEDALVRANVPIFGLAHGENFREYRVEYGEGIEPSEWITVTKSATPQTKDESSYEMYKSDDLTIHGNLATWDTGLDNYVYLPLYPKDHPINLKGIYTLRLVVTANDSKTVEDRITVEVASVIPNAMGGSVTSKDNKVTLSVPEQSIMDSFRLISIKQADPSNVSLPSGRKLVGSVYEAREPGELFTKEAKLKISFSKKEIGKNNPDELGIFAYNAKRATWEYLRSYRALHENSIYTNINRLHPYYALMVSSTTDEGSVLVADLGKNTDADKSDIGRRTGQYLVKDTFENGQGEWSNRDGNVGAEVSVVEAPRAGGGKVLKVTNKHAGGNFAVNVIKTPFDAREFPVVRFDYNIAPDIKTNFLVKASGRWYEIGFTDDFKELRDKRVNIAHIGDIDGVVADSGWRAAKFNLYDMLRTKTGNTIIDEMIMADWDVGGYMKLEFGHNAKGATYYLDNFSIGREASVAKMGGNVIEVDNFNHKEETNALGEPTFTFDSSDGGFLAVDLVGEDADGSGHALNLRYDVSKPRSYAGYVSSLGSLDLRGYQALSLFVKASGDGQDFLVGLKDRSGHEQRVSIDEYLPEKITTASWQHATIPLVAFTDIKDWGRLENLSLSFVNSIHDKGAVIVDQIEFRKEIGSLRVDNFERFNGRNLLGGNQLTFVSGAAAINGQYSKGSPNGIYRLSYGGNIGAINAYASEVKSYAGWTTELRGIDCSQCGTLSFRVRGAEGGENATIYLDDGNFRWGAELAKYAKLSTSWQKIEIPLQEFAEYGVDLTHLAELKFVFEGAKMSGTIYLDDIQFGMSGELR